MGKSEFKVIRGTDKYDISGTVVNNHVYILDITIPIFDTPIGGLYRSSEVFITDGNNPVRVREGLIDPDCPINEMEQVVINFVNLARKNDLNICLVTSMIYTTSVLVFAFLVKYCLEKDIDLKIISTSINHHPSLNIMESLPPVGNYIIEDGYALFSSTNEMSEYSGTPKKLIPSISGHLEITDDPSLVIIKTIWGLKSNGLGLFITNISNSFITIQCIRVCTSFKVPLKIYLPSFDKGEESTIIEVIPKEDKK